ncbi:MAG: class I SAM-dependent methyltransferase [Anaerolineae bacterium]|nr:class I SAM-dependent methyltransferase [Anaerolineae bacterium]
MNDTVRQQKERVLWDKQALGYDGRNLKMYKHAYDLSIQKTCAVLSPGQKVLEIGCGTGIIALGIAPLVESVTATDISPQMVAVAESKARDASIHNVDFRVCDGYVLPFDDQSFDIVLLFNVLHFTREPATLLREAHRLLKPGGYVVGATDCYAEPVPMPIGLMIGIQSLLKQIGVIPFMWHYKKEDLHRLLEECSFDIVETDVLHPAPVNYYVCAKKA